MRTMNVVYKGIEVEVCYEAFGPSAGGRDSLGGVANAGPPLEPDEPGGIEIDSIEHGGEDISELLSPEAFEAIQLLVEEGLE